jgi:hypothetical protein
MQNPAIRGALLDAGSSVPFCGDVAIDKG